MKKYLCVVRSASGKCKPPSPSEMEDMYDKFNAWKNKFESNIFDMGAKLGESGKVVSQAKTLDGPFVEVKEIIGGFMIIEAESMDKAIEVVKESPGVGSPESSVEIREMIQPPMEE
jgi:hypothetical protein